MKNSWLEIDKEGLRKTLGQKDKFFLLTEMISNAWDEDVSEVAVSLSRPDDAGQSWLRVIDNSPTGWADLTHAHTLFADSTKKGKADKRGRFNMGEKDVLALAIEASLTTVTGQVLFNADGTRTAGTETRAVGSEFAGRFNLTIEEFEHIMSQAKLLLPPKDKVTIINGVELPYREPVGQFTESLSTVLADKEGVMRNGERQTSVTLYDCLPGEVAMIYEMGIPIVELGDDKWHVNVGQKVPLSRDRDNVNPVYLKKIRVAVLNAKFAELAGDDAGAKWVGDAMGCAKSSDEAVTHVLKAKFGNEFVSRSVRDIGSIKEVTSRGINAISSGSMSKAEWDRAKAVIKSDGTPLMQSSAQIAPTEGLFSLSKTKIIPVSAWSAVMKAYAKFVETVAPRLINLPVTVRYIDDEDVSIQGCFQKGFKGRAKQPVKREFGMLTVNLAYHDPASSTDNYELLLHELAHNKLMSNDHLDKVFYEEVTELGAKLAILALAEPKLFRSRRSSDRETAELVELGKWHGGLTSVEPAVPEID
jgi:hypothetical protein